MSAFCGFLPRAPQRRRRHTSPQCCTDLHVRVLADPPSSRRTALLVHDFLTDSRLYNALAAEPQLADTRLLGVDLRGHGLSPMPKAAYRHSEDLRTIAEAEEGGLHLVGSGYGGSHCLEACLLAPHHFQSVVVIGSGLPGYAWPQSAFMKLDYTLAHTQTAVAQFIQRSASWNDTLANAERQTVGALKEMVRDYQGLHFKEMDPEKSNSGLPLRMRIAELSAPLLSLVGERDCEHFRAMAQQINDGVLNPAFSEAVLVKGSGHFCVLEKPAIVAEHLVRFWDMVESGRMNEDQGEKMEE